MSQSVGETPDDHKKTKEKDEYNAFRIPPNLKHCEKHLQSNRVYRHTKEVDSHMKQREQCGCCGHHVENERLPVKCELKELAHLGASFPLFFQTIKFAILMLFIMLAVMGCYALVSNVAGGDCQTTYENEEKAIHAGTATDPTKLNKCENSPLNVISFGNKREHYEDKTIQLWLVFSSIWVLFIFNQFFRKHTRQAISSLNKALSTPADFSLSMEGFPQSATHEKITKFLNDKIELMRMKTGKIAEVKKIMMTYDTTQFFNLSHKISSLTKAHFKAKNQAQKDKIFAELQRLHNNLNEIENKETERRFTGRIFVVFNLPSQCHDFLVYYRINFYRAILMNLGLGRLAFVVQYKDENLGLSKSILVRRAPEPTDVIWENLGVSWTSRLKRRIVAGFFTAIILGVCFVILAAIAYGQLSVRQNDKAGNVQRVLSFCGSIAILVINKSLQGLMRVISALEKHTSHTDYFLSVSQKLSAVLFFNTAITVLFAHFSLYWAGDEVNNPPNNDNVWGNGGLVENVWSILWSNAYISPIMNLLDPVYFLTIAQRKRVAKTVETLDMTQSEAHLIFEDPEFDIAERYAVLIKTVWLTAFYATLIPIGLVISLSGLIVTYWVEKYLLLKRSSYPKAMGAALPKSILELLEVTPLFYAIGSLIFNYYAAHLVHLDDLHLGVNVVAVLMAVVYLMLPIKVMNKFICRKKKEVEEDCEYDERRIQFQTDYDIANPITHKQAAKELKKYLKSKNAVDKNLNTGKQMDGAGFADLNLRLDNVFAAKGTMRNVYNGAATIVEKGRETPLMTPKSVDRPVILTPFGDGDMTERVGDEDSVRNTIRTHDVKVHVQKYQEDEENNPLRK
jgi:hypothetical protein